jgi:hypothetical protein
MSAQRPSEFDQTRRLDEIARGDTARRRARRVDERRRRREAQPRSVERYPPPAPELHECARNGCARMISMRFRLCHAHAGLTSRRWRGVR